MEESIFELLNRFLSTYVIMDLSRDLIGNKYRRKLALFPICFHSQQQFEIHTKNNFKLAGRIT